MDEAFNTRYKKVLEILPDAAECAHSKLILVGGTALALFYLRHRISVDLDFVPVSGDEVKLKEKLKGCLTKNGYRTTVGAFKNQFIIQFEATSIKVEVFKPERKVTRAEEHVLSGVKVKVASLNDILRMKVSAYSDRREARDAFDVFCILRSRNRGAGIVKKLILKSGPPENMDEVRNLALDNADVIEFERVISDAVSKTGR